MQSRKLLQQFERGSTHMIIINWNTIVTFGSVTQLHFLQKFFRIFLNLIIMLNDFFYFLPNFTRNKDVFSNTFFFYPFLNVSVKLSLLVLIQVRVLIIMPSGIICRYSLPCFNKILLFHIFK